MITKDEGVSDIRTYDPYGRQIYGHSELKVETSVLDKLLLLQGLLERILAALSRLVQGTWALAGDTPRSIQFIFPEWVIRHQSELQKSGEQRRNCS